MLINTRKLLLSTTTQLFTIWDPRTTRPLFQKKLKFVNSLYIRSEIWRRFLIYPSGNCLGSIEYKFRRVFFFKGFNVNPLTTSVNLHIETIELI